jgi:hypothetical protein
MDAFAPAPTAVTSLAPRSVVQDGHEFYVYMSIVLLNVHDQHESVRYRLWDMFCRLVWKAPLSEIATTTLKTPALNHGNEETKPILDACIRYLGLEQQAREDHGAAAVSERIREYVVRQMTRPLPAPLRVVCPLVARTFRLGMVLYDASAAAMTTTTAEKNDTWEPTCTWDPPPDTLPPLRYVHLLQRRNTLQMLVNRKPDGVAGGDGNAINDVRALVPTRVIGTLPTEFKTHYLFEAASSEEIVARAVYSLRIYDNAKRCHLTVGSFVSPAATQDPNVRTLHYLRLDMTINRQSDYVYLIHGCQQVQHPFVCASPSLSSIKEGGKGWCPRTHLRVFLAGDGSHKTMCNSHWSLARGSHQSSGRAARHRRRCAHHTWGSQSRGC